MSTMGRSLSQTPCTSLASKSHLSSYWLPAPAHHLVAGCDCVVMTTPPGWPAPIPANTDIATASAARTLRPLMLAPGLEGAAGGEGPCWMTAAGEPMGSVEGSLGVSSPPAAIDRERNIHPRKAAFFCMTVTGQSLWAKRSCFSWATSFLSRVTSLVRETFMLARSSAFFSKEQTQTFRFCRQREAAARFLSRKRCLLSSGSISEARRRRPPVGWAGDTCGWTGEGVSEF